jgi:hypothetical protein
MFGVVFDYVDEGHLSEAQTLELLAQGQDAVYAVLGRSALYEADSQ